LVIAAVLNTYIIYNDTLKLIQTCKRATSLSIVLLL